MKKSTIVGIVFLVFGFQGFIYGGFSQLMNSHKSASAQAAIPAHKSQMLTVSLWAGAGAIVMGGLILLVGSRKEKD